MKKLIALFAGMFLITLSANVFAQAGNTDTEEATSAARIILPITVENVRGLDFGTIASTPAGGTVVATAAATTELTFSNEDMAVTTLGTPTSAEFTIEGEANALFSIVVEDATVLDGPGTDMTLEDFTSSLGWSNVTLTGGEVTLYVGATLNVGANQAAGEYNGTFDVTVAYN